MKKVFTFCLALGFTFLANAQMPDPTNWEKGQDITDELAWRDIDGWWTAGGVGKDGGVNMLPNESPYWKGTQPNEMAWVSTSQTDVQGYAAMGFYTDGAATTALVYSYQIIPLPAGAYTITVNSVYREGTPADTWNNFLEGNSKKNAHLFVNYQTTDDDAEDAAATRSYDRVIKNLAQSDPDIVTESLYSDGDSWKYDASFTKTVGDETVTLWYPNCDEGAALHFEAGNFLNTLNFVVPKDGYVRFGFKKTANIDQDWLVWANFRMYYNGPADEQAEIDLALEELDAVFDEALQIQDKSTNNGYQALAAIIEDELIEFGDTYAEDDYESIVEAIANLNEMVEGYKKSYNSAASLGDLLEMSQDMAAATDFPGMAAFQAAISDASTVAFAQDPAEIDYNAAAYVTAFSSLSAERANYLNSQEASAEDGSKDFTMLIKHPWFVNAEYTPVKLDDGTWCIQQDGVTDMWRHYTVAQGATEFYSNGVPNSNIVTGDRVDVCSKVALRADDEIANRWYKVTAYTTGWSSGLKLMYQGALVGVSDGWNSISVGDIEIHQRMEGLPEGYYQLRALMRGYDAIGSWSSQADPHHNIFAKNTDEYVVKSPVGCTDNDTEAGATYGWYEWNAAVWQEHKTSIIQAPDGVLEIGAQSSMVMNATGFRLYFMGENPDFDGMIQEEINNINTALEDIAFEGDKAVVNGYLAQIAECMPIAGQVPLYEQALAYAKLATDYITTVNKAMKSWSADEDFLSLQSNYEVETEPYEMLQPAVDFILELGSSVEDTYEDAIAAADVYDAYESYMAMYDKCAAVGSEVLDALLATQAATVKAAYQDVETLNAFEAELAANFSSEFIKSAGGEGASEANPVDITGLIVNPTFDEGAATGWSGQSPTQNEYARHNSEVWNVTTWDTYQVIKGLPAGKYQLKVQALYRDADGGAVETYTANWTAAGGDKDTWAQEGYPALYAQTSEDNDVFDYITSVADLNATAPSFLGYFNIPDAGYTVGSDGTFLFFDELTEEDKENARLEDGSIVYDTAYDLDGDAVQYPFDARLDLDGGSLYYPESMAGAYIRFSEGNYDKTSVTINVPNNGDDLTIGIRKDHEQSGNWVIFSNFRLYFLGYDATGIEAAKVKETTGAKLFNIAGQAVGNEYKGIVIKNGQKVLNK